MTDRAGTEFKVAVIYHLWPHYRRAVMEAMDQSEVIAYSFFGSGEAFNGIEHADTRSIRAFVEAKFRFFGPFMWQPKGVEAAFGPYDAIIYLGDPNFLSTWVGSFIAFTRRIPVLYWAHGWLRHEPFFKKKVRKLFYSFAKHMLVYGERAKQIGISLARDPETISVVYNSLDVPMANTIIDRISFKEINPIDPHDLFENSDRPIIICTARLTKLCRFDLLIEASAILANRNIFINVLLVGDGPEMNSLKTLATENGIDAVFFGACYDEETIGQLIYHSDITVSPGKVGLTAMHSLMYGTPVITHDSFDDQMPEFEAIKPGITGEFFKQNNAQSLADTIQEWLNSMVDRSSVRSAARREIQEKWNPARQASIIEHALLKVLENGKA